LQRRVPIGRCVKKKKADTEHPFEHGEVIHLALDGHTVTTKIQDTGDWWHLNWGGRALGNGWSRMGGMVSKTNMWFICV
jgi:hypothetical protein